MGIFLLFVDFTESDCSRLYYRAIKDDPTITLHIAKAMTIGPPQVGKTSLRHLFLGKPPPAVSVSTPALTAAETVIINLSEKLASKGAVRSELFLASSGSQWMSVDEDKGIHSLHQFLQSVLAEADLGEAGLTEADLTEADLKEADLTEADLTEAGLKEADLTEAGFEEADLKEAELKEADLAEAGLKEADLTEAGVKEADLKEADFAEADVTTALESSASSIPQVPNSDNDNVSEGSHSTSAVPVQQQKVDVSLSVDEDPSDFTAASQTMISRIYRVMQNRRSDLNFRLPDAHLLQFLDSGGQLAYHDILPIFVNMPAIYLHVFNLTKELSECPRDEIKFSDGTEGLSATSPLTVAQMMTRSVMTVSALADRKVQLPGEVQPEGGHEPHVAFIGTHLDKLIDVHGENTPKKLGQVGDKLREILPSYSLEKIVMKYQHSRRFPMFFPINNIMYAEESGKGQAADITSVTIKYLKKRIQDLVGGVKVKVPVKWYLYQLMEWDRRLQEEYCPVRTYKELYRSCHKCIDIGDGEFYAMVTYFHALGLLIHICGANASQTGHNDCLVFTNPSYLFENISKLYRVQFEEAEGESMILLQREGKLTKSALPDLEVDVAHLSHNDFMDILVKFFIGVDIEPIEGVRTLFVPSVLTNSPDIVNQFYPECGIAQSLCFAITFKDTLFIPCGVFTGMIARLFSVGWKTYHRSNSRMCMKFSVGPLGTVCVFDHATHFGVMIHRCEGLKVEDYQEYRDTIIEQTADSYCFLFHNKAAKDCNKCRDSPYLVLGQTCQKCTTQSSAREAPHFAKLKVKQGVPISIRCEKTPEPKVLNGDFECAMFQNISHYVSCWLKQGA